MREGGGEGVANVDRGMEERVEESDEEREEEEREEEGEGEGDVFSFLCGIFESERFCHSKENLD